MRAPGSTQEFFHFHQNIWRTTYSLAERKENDNCRFQKTTLRIKKRHFELKKRHFELKNDNCRFLKTTLNDKKTTLKIKKTTLNDWKRQLIKKT